MKGENTATENGAALIMIPVVVDDEPFAKACTWKSRPHSNHSCDVQGITFTS